MSNHKLASHRRKPAKKIGSFLALGIMVGVATGYAYAWITLPIPAIARLQADQATVCFTPGGNCLQLIRQVINQAQKQIFVQAYAFTAPAIMDALIAAHQRGVEVRILVDRSQLTGKGSQVKKAQAYGLWIAVDRVPGIAHNKVMLMDDAYVLTGSFNWSHAAEYKNAENLLWIHNKGLYTVYKQNWERRAALAKPISEWP
jgi:phospholipase D